MSMNENTMANIKLLREKTQRRLESKLASVNLAPATFGLKAGWDPTPYVEYIDQEHVRVCIQVGEFMIFLDTQRKELCGQHKYAKHAIPVGADLAEIVAEYWQWRRACILAREAEIEAEKQDIPVF